jgi:NADH dehydrogenase FAD-containing subunit
MTAQAAISQGKYCAYAIMREMKNRKLKPYNPKQSRFIIPLGGKYALIDFRFIKLSGFFAWLLKHFVALGYFFSILPFFNALTLWFRGLKVYLKND